MMLQYLDAAILAGEVVEHTELPMPAVAYGAIVMGILLLLMLITASFANLGNRHSATEEHIDPHKQHVNNHDHGEAQRH
ncbi:apolipoprotein N-acyltransferase [Arthrobacter sp. CAN_A6]|uniref:hypothetical protein n=1 Tax=Arthrobacter sp. CAN_A6 TaxID=2787721 RepID=UPI0018C9D104